MAAPCGGLTCAALMHVRGDQVNKALCANAGVDPDDYVTYQHCVDLQRKLNQFRYAISLTNTMRELKGDPVKLAAHADGLLSDPHVAAVSSQARKRGRNQATQKSQKKNKRKWEGEKQTQVCCGWHRAPTPHL